jgi:hypothetical protein
LSTSTVTTRQYVEVTWEEQGRGGKTIKPEQLFKLMMIMNIMHKETLDSLLRL